MSKIKEIFKTIIPEKQRLAIWQWIFKLRGLLYKGNKVYCVCCNRSFRTFLPFGNPPRPNANCPYCHSLERHRLLWFYLKGETNFFTEKLNVLHFAPEFIFERKFKELPNLKYLTADINPALAMVKEDITELSFKGNRFDVILCSHVLAHIDDEEKAISELYRVLNKGGWAVVLTTIDFNRQETYEVSSAKTREERLKVYGDSEIARIHGKDFADRLRKKGFKVNEIDYIKKFDKEQIEKFGLIDNEIIFHCTK